MTYQLVLPHDHQQNLAEKAFQTVKAHFISILCGVDKDFPLHLWDRLLPQAKHTLNMLHTAKVAPNISAYAYLWDQHGYNSNPFVSLGCKVEAHATPGVPETWAAHTVSGYYIGNAWEHYSRGTTIKRNPGCHGSMPPAPRLCRNAFSATMPVT